MRRIDRRKFLQSTGASGLAGILASGQAPAFAQGTTVHWLRLGDFVPASDVLLRRELLPEAEKALGIKITLETINGNELQARIASSIQSGSGADLIHAMHNWPQLYAESVVDVSDVAEDIAKEQGGYYDIFASVAKSAEDPLGNHAVNATGTLNALRAARRHGARRVVYAGSASAYGGASDPAGQDEDTPLCALSPYAAAKLAGEFYLQSFAASYSLETVRLRFGVGNAPVRRLRSQRSCHRHRHLCAEP